MAKQMVVLLFGALICAIIVQVNCSERDAYGELWKKLDNKNLSVAQVDAILEAVPDKEATKIGKVSVAETLKYKELSLDRCTGNELDRSNPDRFAERTRQKRFLNFTKDNKGANKFVRHHFEQLVRRCLDNFDQVLDTIVANIGEQDRQNVQIFAANDKEPVADGQLKEFVRTKSEEFTGEQANLEVSCKHIYMSFLVTEPFKKYSGQALNEPELLKDWYQIKRACTLYLRYFSPFARQQIQMLSGASDNKQSS